jgi:hypothetical protein
MVPKQVLICFKCRITKPVVTVGGVDGVYRKPSNSCQHCGGEMGLYNNRPNPPRRKNVKAWAKFEKTVVEI